MDDFSIRLSNVNKTFKLPHEKAGSVKHLFVNLFRGNRSYEKQQVLKDISIEVKKGEFFGIVGRNGSGKSTLLKILAGIYSPDSGGVEVRGKLVPFIELGVGFNPELTGRENIYLNGALLGFSEEEVDGFYKEVVKFAELDKFMDQKLKNYSSGMQVRLAFSMAIRADADILLIDEVLAVGDVDFQRKCFDYFKRLKKNKKTVIFVSHDMNAVREYCDKALLIEDGSMVAGGLADEVASQYTRLFLRKEAKVMRDASAKRWGESVGMIAKVNTKKMIDKNENSLDINVIIKLNRHTDNPTVGYVIKNSAGQSVTGSNTKLLGIKTGKYKKGQDFNITFELPNIFSEGMHTIDVAVLSSDTSSTYDWWESAAQFNVSEENPSIYVVSPKVKARIK